MNIDKLIGYIHEALTERGGCCGPTLAFLVVIAFMLCGCKTVKSSVTERENTSDSVRVEYIERVVKVPVTVYVEVPVEVKERLTNDTTSHLETGFAVSDAAMVWIDGVPFLRHTLANKPQKIAKTDSVPVTEKERTEWKTRRVTYTKTEIREKQLSKWEQLKVDYGGYGFIVAIIFIALYMVRFFRRFMP